MLAPWSTTVALAAVTLLGCNGTPATPSRPPATPTETRPTPTPGSPGESAAAPDEPDPTPGRYRELAAFGPRTCALRESGHIRCWSVIEGEQVAIAPGVYAHLGREGAHMCGIRADGSVGCPPEAPLPPGAQTSPLGVPPGGPFRELTGSGTYRCGLERSGEIHCGGINALLIPSPPEGRFVSIAGGTAFVCGLTEAGAVRCSTADGPEVQLPGGPFSAIAASDSAVCGLRRADGGVDCSSPAPGGDTDATGFSEIALGMSHRCGIAEGKVHCWGLMPMREYYPPEEEPARHVAVGAQTCILRDDASIGCWDSQAVTARMP